MQSQVSTEVKLIKDSSRIGGVQVDLRSSVMVLMQAVASCVLELTAPSS
jgi:hypothetical protein